MDLNWNFQGGGGVTKQETLHKDWIFSGSTQ